MTLLTYLFIIVFLVGLYFYAKCSDPKYTEGLTNNNNNNNRRCPDLLIQKDAKFYLYNSKLAKVPGVNPVEFQNLEDYTEFIEWQRSQGIRCPVLFLQFSYNAQGDPTYKLRPSPTNLQGGLPSNPASYINNNTNKATQDNIISSSDDVLSPSLEEERDSSLLYSPNAMDNNWGGIEYTNNLIDSGAFNGDVVTMY